MATIERIKADIAELANRPNGVEFDELTRIVRQLGEVGYSIQMKPGKHSYLLRVNDQRATVCKHNPRRKHLKPAYVREFLDMMTALGLFEEA